MVDKGFLRTLEDFWNNKEIFRKNLITFMDIVTLKKKGKGVKL